MLFQMAPLALTWSDLERSNRGQAYFKHISDGCKLETLADRGMVTITVEQEVIDALSNGAIGSRDLLCN